MTITLDTPTVSQRPALSGRIYIDDEPVAVHTLYEVQTYVPSEPGRDRNGGDYAGGILFAQGGDGTLYARDWDSSDWDDRHRWGSASDAERDLLARLVTL